jgi:glycogen debranching enzyme
MDVLSKIADQLGKPEESQQWKQRSDTLLKKLLQRFWMGHEFVSFNTIDGHEIRSESLLLLMPVVLGHRLPQSVQTQLIESLRSRLQQSPFGLPSEPPSSPFYQADGYWRGPIWAPATMIIAEGLDDMGEHTLADALRKKFCLMAQHSGMAENFDAKTGAALRDPAYTWTSSVYLIFAAQLAHTSQPSL